MARSRRFTSTVIALALLCGAFVVGPGARTTASTERTFVVDLRDGVDARTSASIARRYGGRTGQIYDEVVGGFSFKGSAADAARLARDPRVEKVEDDLVYHAVGPPPSDVRHLKRINVPEAYAAGYRGAGVTIGLLDTGVRRSHRVFRAHDNIRHGHSCVGGGTSDGEGHGTHSASQAVGKLGVAHEAALVPVKVFAGSSLNTSLELLICGLNWVRKRNAANPGAIDVVSISIAGPGSASLQKAVNKLLNTGVVIVAAAGNHDGAPLYPAGYKGVIAVSALEGGKTMAWFSAHGASLTALGVNILGAENDGDKAYSFRSGTSRSTPKVAGAAAVVLSENPAANVRSVLRSSGRCPNKNVNLDGGFCSGRWLGDEDKAEPIIDVYCAGILAGPGTDLATCGF